MKVLVLKNVWKSYGDDIQVIKGADLTVEEGELAFILGRSGSGKTTLLEIIAGLEKPDKGNVEIDGFDITHSVRSDVSRIRLTKIGFIFQQHNLIEELTVMENIYLPLKIRGEKGYKKNAEEIIKMLNMEYMKDRIVKDLSLGEHQRVAIARALLMKPSIILADEPTASLDRQNARKVAELLEEIHKKHKATILIVSHDRIFDDMEGNRYLLNDGKLEKMTSDKWREMLERG